MCKLQTQLGISNLDLKILINGKQICYRTVTAGNNIISFSDEELDNLYKSYDMDNHLILTFLLTGRGYTNSKNCTIIFRGNQKTGYVNVDNSWKRCKRWININGEWKRCVRFIQYNGIWKRCV